MKLSITQMALGVLIVFAACFITGWMIFEAPDQLQRPAPYLPSELTIINVIQENGILINIARYSSLALPILGVLILIISTFQSAIPKLRTWRIILINMIAGFLIFTLTLIIAIWGYPTITYIATYEGSDLLVKIFSFPNVPDYTMLIHLFLLPLGLAVFGIAIVQLIKSRKVQTVLLKESSWN